MQHTPERNQPTSPISDTGSSCSRISAASSTSQDLVMDRIAQLTNLVERGIVKKADLVPMISAIYQGCRQDNFHTPTKTSPSDTVGKILQRGNANYRTPASPETCKIRRWIEVPIQRRFELQAATVDSPLWGKVPPRRLNKNLFTRSCESPLEEIYLNHAKSLAKVPSEKVMHVIRWKVRKMRGNLVKKGVAVDGNYYDDGFDWERAAGQATQQLTVRPVPSRGYVHLSTVKKEPSDTSPSLSTCSKPAKKRPQTFDLTGSERSAFNKKPPPSSIDKRKCGKCGKMDLPFPRSIDWDKKRDAVPYCRSCYEILTNECETLAAVPKASAKRKVTNKKKVDTKKKPEVKNTRKKKRKSDTKDDSSNNKKVYLLCLSFFSYRCFSTPSCFLKLSLLFLNVVSPHRQKNRRVSTKVSKWG